MKTYQNESWMNYRRLTPGRRSHIARKVRRVAVAHGLDFLVGLCDRIIQREAALLAKRQQFAAGLALATEATWSPEVLSLDVTLDRLIGELRNFLAALAVRVGTPRGDAAAGLLERYFAQGLRYYTHQPVEEESARVGTLLAGLAADQAEVAVATAEDLVADVAATHGKYAALIESTVQAQRLRFDAIKADDLENHRALLGLLAEILVHTDRLGPAGEALRRELLAEAVAQDAAVAALVRAKRVVAEVDPETGEPTELPPAS